MYSVESGNAEARERQAGPAASGRREFLKQVGTAPVALAAAGAAYGALAVAETLALPQIRLGEHSVSRLICGDNPFKANSHLSVSWHREWVERAFRQTFQSIKPTDAVIVGMYNEFNDEPAENAELVRRYGASLAKPT